jgi:predicted phage-related endonuclease
MTAFYPVDTGDREDAAYEQDRQRQVDDGLERRRFLGGSDAAAVLGLSPWRTPLDIYLEKTGQAERLGVRDPKRERILKRGKRLEPIVVDMVEEELGIVVTRRSTPEDPNRYVDSVHDFLAAEVDFEWRVTPEAAHDFGLDPQLVGSIQNGEVKTVHPFAAGKYGEEGTDEIPVEYGAQAMHGLSVTGRRLTLVAVLVGADNLLTYWIRRDDEVIDGMRAKEVAFWKDHVIARRPPALLNLADCLTMFRRAPASRLEAPPEVAIRVAELIRLSNEARALEERTAEVRFELGAFILGESALYREQKKNGALGPVKPAPGAKPGRHELTVGGAPILTVDLQAQERIDSTTLRERFPEAAAACTKSSTSIVFRPKRTK